MEKIRTTAEILRCGMGLILSEPRPLDLIMLGQSVDDRRQPPKARNDPYLRPSWMQEVHDKESIERVFPQ